MAAQALRDTDGVWSDAEVWDGGRLAALVEEVGEEGLRDILRLFQADLAFLQDQLGSALGAGDEAAARLVLGNIADAAAGIGLAALAQSAKCLSETPLDRDGPLRIAREAQRVRALPALRHTR